MRRIHRWASVLLLCAASAPHVLAQEPPPPEGAPPPPAEERPPHRHGRMERWWARPLTPEEEQQAIEFVRQLNPDRASRLKRLKIIAPEVYRRAIRRILWTQARMAELEGRDSLAYARQKRIFQLNAHAEDLAMRYRESTDPQERERLRAALIDTLSILFDLREQDKWEEIQRMERRLKHLRRVVEQRRQNKQAIVERRAKELLGELDTLEW